MIDPKKLIDARVHFGHKTDRWSPLMKPYIWGKRSGVHLIDVSKTAFQLERAAKFLESVASQGKQVLWVGSKRPAQETIQAIAAQLEMPYVNHRWVGGTLTNWPQVKRSVTKMLHFEDVLSKAEKFPHYTKKELSEMNKRLDKLKTIVDGIRNLRYPVGALVVVDVTKEATAVKEASKMGVPVVALVDTNSDPSAVDYVIPGNDDAPRAIKVILDYLQDAVNRGKEAAKALKVKKEEAPEVLEVLEAVEAVDVQKLALDEEEELEAGPSKRAKRVAKVGEEDEAPAAKKDVKPKPKVKDVKR